SNTSTHGVQASAGSAFSLGSPSRANSRSSSCQACMSSSCSPSPVLDLRVMVIVPGSSRVRPGGAVKLGTDYTFADYRLDPRARVLWRGADLVRLPPRALDLLLALVERQGDVVSKEDLLRRVWPDTVVEEANLSVNVSALRKELGAQPDGAPFIETVARRGYRFRARVEGGPAVTPPPIAVLPFRVLGPEAFEDYLAVGMADALITRL